MQIAARSLLFTLLATAALCIRIKKGSPSASQVCNISSELAQTSALSDGATIDPASDGEHTLKALQTSVKELQEQLSLLEQERERQESAMQVSLNHTGEQLRLAQSKLWQAEESLLEVPAADDNAMQSFETRTAGKDTLMIFYALWCPHCIDFVLHDAEGNPKNAPLEVFNHDLQKIRQDVMLLRVNVQNHMDILKKSKVFHVRSIPTAYFVNKAGVAFQFEGNPHDTDALLEFIDANCTNAVNEGGVTARKALAY